MKIQNTLSKNKEEFIPEDVDNVKLYQCGPTVYWTQHIGNLRAAFVADIVHRTLIYLGYKVNFVRNYTDVGHLTGDNLGDADTGEDRIEKASKREGLSPEDISKKYTDLFIKDTQSLNILTPTHSPKATEHIKEMQEMIEVLIEKDFAYTTPLAVYFDVSKATEYNRLSGQILEKNIDGEGHGKTTDENKRNQEDFALWFFKAGAYKEALQTWPSTFKSDLVKDGEGFPGWHIECSAMSKKYLGNSLDIHMGGIEHIPIHHTNEIAQSENANDAVFSKYWMHYEHLLVDNKKMSKSEGTSYSLEELIKKGFSPLSLRFFYLQAHYRSKQNFTWEALKSAESGLNNLYRDLSNISSGDGEINEDFKNKFIERLSDDFNTPQALSTVFDVLKSDISSKDKYATIIDFDNVLGLDLEKNSLNKEISIDNIPESVRDLIVKREEARKEKDFNTSDSLREEILSNGYLIEDGDNGIKISKI